MISTTNELMNKDLHTMRSRRVDRPYRRKQHASLHGMFAEPSHEIEAYSLFVHSQDRSHPVIINEMSQSMGTFRDIHGESGEISTAMNKWNTSMNDDSQVNRNGLLNWIQSTNSRLVRV